MPKKKKKKDFDLIHLKSCQNTSSLIVHMCESNLWASLLNGVFPLFMNAAAFAHTVKINRDIDLIYGKLHMVSLDHRIRYFIVGGAIGRTNTCNQAEFQKFVNLTCNAACHIKWVVKPNENTHMFKMGEFTLRSK